MIVVGLNQPVGIVNAGDGSGRLFVLEQPGLIRIIQNNQLLPEPFLDISHQVTCCGERGLLGLAFHPDYLHTGWFFVNYIDLEGNTVIARYQQAEDQNRADAASETKLIVIAQPYGNHNGGGMAFGPDGYLYLGLGDGGSGGDPLGHAQNQNSLLGKLLRVDVDQGDSYAIPADNPYVQGGGAPEVWGIGLRNPWRFSFDQETGDLYIGDVGQGSWEEINYLPAGSSGGSNFGWNYREGQHAYASAPTPEGVNLIDPVAEYGHDQGISVTGGVVYRGEQLPAWQGIYFYGDYGSGLIWGLIRNEVGFWLNEVLFQTEARITSFGEDESGEIYLADMNGSIYKLIRK
jgi:glucose/arabinose dehydrogenase